MTALPKALYNAAQVGELDRLAIKEQGIPGIVLMKRAGRALLGQLLTRWPQVDEITVYCGAGNNGGDGYVLAALLQERRITVRLVQVAPADKLQGDAHKAWQYAQQAGVAITAFDPSATPKAGLVVDALLGTGLAGAVREPYAQAIAQINHSGLPVVSVDIPSGLCSDTGAELGVAVAATLTVSFIGLKRGLFTGRGPGLAGEVVFDDLQVPTAIFNQVPFEAERLDWAELLAQFPARPRDAHKGDFGHVMIIGGDQGLGGAVAMAAEAALRVGAGLVSVATRPEHVPAILARRPEVMVRGVTSGQELEPLLQRPSVVVVGPGLGRSPWSEHMLQKAAAAGLPLVADADALNILSEGRVAAEADKSRWLLTPHPGEAGRLLGISATDVQADRFSALAALQEKWGAAVLLKGPGTLTCATVTRESMVGVCTSGNPGMASGGMGDVLSGVIGGLLAQGLPVNTAMCLGVCLHAEAADRAAAVEGQRGLLATDLMPHLRRLVNG